MKKKTEYHFLPELGRPVSRMADRILEIEERIKSIKKQAQAEIDEYVKEQGEIISELEETTKKLWTVEERAAAREAFDEYVNTNNKK